MGEEKQSFFGTVMAELSRRKVLKTVGAYAVGVFVVLQAMEAVAEPLRFPEWLPTLVVVTLILGFPIVFALAWQFDITGEGIRRTRDSELLGPLQRFSLFSLLLIATGGLALSFYQYYAGVFEPADSPTALAEAADRSFTAPENSIAVLPFRDLSASHDQEYLSDGLAEEILNLLAQVDGLQVAARTSSFAFRDREDDIRTIGQALNVRTVLEGSLRTSGNQVRLSAQLVNVEDGYQIWSQTFERELDDIFALQDEVASAIATSLVDNFEGLEAEAPTARTQNIAAFEAYRAGRLHWWRRTPQELERAIALFGEALQHDPQFAPAYAALADSYILLSLYGDSNRMRAVQRAQPYIEKALALDPESAEAFAALGLARMEIGQNTSAESSLRQAIRLNEAYVPARLWLSNVLGNTGRIGEQALVLEEAMAVDPLNELLAINYAGNLNSRGNYEEASDMLRSLLLVKPDSTNLLRTYSSIAFFNGDLVQGWTLARQAYDIDPDSPQVIQMLSKAWLELGNTERAEALLEEAMDIAADNMELKGQYFQLLLLDGRLEEAESMVRDIFGAEVDVLPENFQRYYHQQMGLIRLVARDLPAALVEFEQAIDPEENGAFKGDQLFSLTAAAFLHEVVGDPELAEERLAQAERALNRARINGLDNPDIYYNESVIDVLHEDYEGAVEALQAAYDRGWRQTWVLDIDGRLEPLHEMPAYIELRQTIEQDIQQARAEIESLAMAMLR
jgi:TolB-like protein/Flp pilus assembly protein TadD